MRNGHYRGFSTYATKEHKGLVVGDVDGLPGGAVT